MSDDTVREVGRFEYWCLRTLDGVRDGCTWMTQKFASWFATAWLYIILWSVVLIAFSVLLYIDAIFSRSLAPDSINPLSFQGMGIAYRLFAAGFLMAAARCAIKDIPGRWTFRALGAFASIIVCLHAFGFGFEALSDKRDTAEIIEATQENIQTDTAAIIGQLEGQKTQIRTDLKVAVDPLTQEIERLDTDGKLNEDLATIQKNRRTALQDSAQDKIDAIDSKILGLLTPESSETALTGAQARAEAEYAQKWHPLFVGLAQLANTTWAPTDNQIYIAAIVFIIFWVLLAESLVIFLPERIYMMHLRDAQLADDKPKKTIKLKDGQSAMLFNSQAERDEYEDLLTRGRNSKAGVEKRESTMRRRDKRIEALDYYSEKITEALDRATRLKWKPQGIADSVFNMSLGEMIHMLEQQLDMGRISQADYDLITGGQIVNGKDKFTDDEGGDDADDTQPTAST